MIEVKPNQVYHEVVSVHISTYNALPTSMRRTDNGTRYVLVNGVWKPVVLVRTKK